MFLVEIVMDGICLEFFFLNLRAIESPINKTKGQEKSINRKTYYPKTVVSYRKIGKRKFQMLE